MTSMPAPIAVALSEYENENPSFRKLWRLVDVYEALLKYATVLAVQNFYDAQLKGRFPAVDSQICNRITRPLLSDWKDLLGKVLQCFAEREDDLFCRDLFLFHFRSFGQNPDRRKSFTDQGAAGKLLNLRNSLAHGATLPDDEAATRVKEHEKDLQRLLGEAAFFANLPLFYVEAQAGPGEFMVQPLMGAKYRDGMPITFRAATLFVGHVVVHNPQTGAFLDLHPLLLYAECLEEVSKWDEARQHIVGKVPCSQRKVLFYDTLKEEDRIVFLDYWRGHHSRFKSPHPLPVEFRTHFPKPTRLVQQADWSDNFIRERTAHFVGRESELEEINRFTTGSHKRVLVVVGAPGMGKSTLLAKWADEHTAVRHFIREGDAATYNTLRVFENLTLQLSERFGVEWTAPSRPEPGAYRRAFEEVLRKAAEKAEGQVVVVVDGLDEAARGSTTGRGVETGQTLVDWLPDPALLPHRISLIVSTRPELLEHSAFAAKFGQDKAEWLELSKLADTDVRALLYQVRSKYEVLEVGEYVDAIVQQSQGNPLYLRMLLEDLEEGRLTFGQFDELPRGVIDYFARTLEFIEGEGRTREMSDLEPLLRAKQETLEALMAQGILTREQADAQLERERAALEGRAGVKSVDLLGLYCLVKEPFLLSDAAAVLNADLVEAQRAFDIIRTVLVNDGKGRFAVFHTGFRDYFLNLSHYTETKLHRHADTIARIQDNLLSYCARWQEHKEPYALRYYAEHLRESKRWTELFALARSTAFRQTQVQVFSDDPDLSLRTIRTALWGAAEAGNAAAMAEFLLTHVQVLWATRQETPLDALRAGQLERAWQLTDLYEGNLRVLWPLLLAWESGERGRIEEMQRTLERLRARKISLPGDLTWASELACLFVHLLDIDQMAVSPLWGCLLADNSAREQCVRALVDRGYFSAACELAQEVTEAALREKLLHDIVIAQVRTGQIPAACETAQKIKQTEWKARALVSVAEAQAQSGNRKAARETCMAALRAVQGVEQHEDRGKILRDIAVIQAVAGQKKRARETLAEALRSAQKVEQHEGRGKILRDIAILQVTTGQKKRARETLTEALRSAQKIEKAEQRAEVLEAVATAQETIGAREGARKTLALAVEAAQAATWNSLDDIFYYAKVTWLTSIATTQRRIGDKEAALMTLAAAVEAAQEAVPLLQPYPLQIVAEAYAQIRGLASAFEVIQKFELKFASDSSDSEDIWKSEGDRQRASAFAAFAVARAQEGDFAAAFEIVQRIERDFTSASKIFQMFERGQAQAEALVSIAEIQARRGDLAAADESVQRIRLEQKRLEALQRIAVAQAQVGEFDTALRMMERVKPNGHWNWTEDMASIIKQLVQAGKFAVALATVDTIESGRKRAELLWGIAIAQARSGEREAAYATREKLRTTLAKVFTSERTYGWIHQWQEALRPTAELSAKIGRFTAALRFARKITEAKERVTALSSIAVKQAQAGERESARATFVEALEVAKRSWPETDGWISHEQIVTLRSLAVAQARVGEFAAALETTRDPRLEYARAGVLGSMAAAQVRAGDKEAARKLFADAIEMAQAQDTMEGGEALADIAAAQAEIGEFTAALETARKIEDTDRQAIALAYITREQAQLGNKEEAQSLLASALETAQESIVSNAEILGLIAVSLARAGEFTLAFETLEHADFDDEESAEEIYESVYGEIGIIGIRQVKSGQPEAAWKRFFEDRETQIEEWIRNGHNLYLLDITAAFAEAEDHRIFERLLIPCAYSPRAAFRMCGLLFQIYPEQVEAVAAVVMREK